MELNVGGTLQDLAALHANNMLIITLGMVFVGAIFFGIARFLRRKGQVGPILDLVIKYSRPFNEISLFLFHLLVYLTGQLLYVTSNGEIFLDVVQITLIFSFIIGGLIGAKIEKRTFRGDPGPTGDRDEKKIPVRKEGELSYYVRNEQRPIPWDNLSHGFWKRYDSRIFWSALVGLVLVLLFAVGGLFFMVFLVLYSILNDPWIPGVVSLMMCTALFIYLILNLRKLVFLSKVRGWEYTSLSHPDLGLERIENGVSGVLESNGFSFEIEVYKLMGNRYLYHKILECDLYVRLMYSNSPIRGEYTISIGPIDNANKQDREMIKYHLSKWGRSHIRPRIGYYKILDASYLWRNDRSDIDAHLQSGGTFDGLE